MSHSINTYRRGGHACPTGDPKKTLYPHIMRCSEALQSLPPQDYDSEHPDTAEFCR